MVLFCCFDAGCLVLRIGCLVCLVFVGLLDCNCELICVVVSGCVSLSSVVLFVWFVRFVLGSSWIAACFCWGALSFC